MSEVEEAENIQLIRSNSNNSNKPVDEEHQKLLETEYQKLSRKQKRQPETWKMNVNKVLCQSGKKRQDVKGNIRRGRNLKTLKNCESNCRLKEKTGIEDNERNIREKHVQGKTAAKLNRDLDKQNEDEQIAIVCFDLENVFALPPSNISCFFYSRKLNTYNLIAHCSLQKQAHCCIWSEGTQGRKGSDIASVLIRKLDHVIDDFPHIKTIIFWSDSCVPQNKNSIMSLALMKFFEQHPTMEEIVQKFGEPGHSSIQEVDDLHSQIEKKLSNLEIFSPLGLLHLLSTVNQRKPFKVFHMRENKDFRMYKEATQTMNFKKMSYASLKQLKYCSTTPTKVYYKLYHNDETYTEVPIVY
ncbi:hypothetical protein ILUMI_00267 [Ignelater luminosus]|uniref:Uncharacterized protein n=1 Tax=Ignelater luminosus TaxID=2038154 RepID=A0A8K0GQE3_IGNLU|nr:hypothetical protein ILUMI_00267 [Ignelater luminosus]